MRIYLDNAATTPMAQEVIDVMVEVMKSHYGNPSSIHAQGREVRTLIEEARKTVAQHLNVTPSEIFFTSGGTEADNMAIRCSVEDLGIERIISSGIEHHAVLYTIEELQKKHKISFDKVALKENGAIDMAHLEELLKSSDKKTLVSLMHANNEIGNLIDLNQVADLCHTYNALFHSDTVQTMAHYRFDLQATKVDFLAASAHKFNGPKGVGFIYVSNRNKLKPLLTGGSQERNMRAGTENLYGIVGLAKAMDLAYAHLDEKQSHIKELKRYMIERLKAEISDVRFNGEDYENSLYTVLSVSFPPSAFSEMMLFKLDIEGVSVSGGSACSSGTDIGSHVLGSVSSDPSRANVRFSFSKYNTKEEIDYVIEKLKAMHS